MKIDHLVVNVDKEYQTDPHTIEDIRNVGLPYEPKWGKGTSGFKASNIWIGDEYFELIRLLKEKGGGWRKEWVESYNKRHRGLICLFIETDNINENFSRIKNLGIDISTPKYLQFKWCFGLLTRTMPWQNSYLPFFENIPFQLGFQQMKDEASKNWMKPYMVPNSRENGIDRISAINIYGNYTKNDNQLICNVFPDATVHSNRVIVEFTNNQKLSFIQNESHYIEVQIQCIDEELKGKGVDIHNIKIQIV